MDGDRGPFSGPAGDLDPSLESADDAVQPGQPVPGAGAEPLGGEVRLEQPAKGLAIHSAACSTVTWKSPDRMAKAKMTAVTRNDLVSRPSHGDREERGSNCLLKNHGEGGNRDGEGYEQRLGSQRAWSITPAEAEQKPQQEACQQRGHDAE